MTRDELQQTLANLHDTLTQTGEVDQETRELLQSITADIQRVLAGDAQAGEPDESFSGRLKDMVVEFEVKHPQIGGLLERLSDGLANLGI